VDFEYDLGINDIVEVKHNGELYKTLNSESGTKHSFEVNDPGDYCIIIKDAFQDKMRYM